MPCQVHIPKPGTKEARPPAFLRSCRPSTPTGERQVSPIIGPESAGKGRVDTWQPLAAYAAGCFLWHGNWSMDGRAPICVWLKRDLRTADHAALATAVARARGGCVFAVFLYEPKILSQPEWSSSHTEFQAECLRDLEPSLGRLGIRLVTRRGEAVAMLERLAQETGFRVLIAHEEMGRARPRPKVHPAGGQWRCRALAS